MKFGWSKSIFPRIKSLKAKAFSDAVGVGSIIVTKLDSDAKGGGALSAVAATNSPILFYGTGEDMSSLEVFDAKSFVSRMLGFGDVMAFARKMEEIDLDKQKEVAQDIITDTEKQIQLAEADAYKINDKTQDYQRYKLNLENTSSAIETKRSRKNQITTLLNRIIYTIPQEATITQIQNTEKTAGSSIVQHIKIDVQAREYDKIAYFVAKLKNASVLENIVSTEGSKEGDHVKISIEGDLKTY